MRRLVLITLLLAACLLPPVNASHITIDGTTCNGSDYNPIGVDDNYGNSLVWLDFVNDYTPWYEQCALASSLNANGVENISRKWSLYTGVASEACNVAPVPEPNTFALLGTSIGMSTIYINGNI